MADDQGTTFYFKGDTSQAEASLDQFGEKLMGMGKGLGLAFGALFAADKLIQFFNDSTKAAMESEAAVREFNSTLKAANVFTEELSASFQDYAQSLQDATGVQDEVILKGAKTLIEIGNLSGQQLTNTITAGLNLAAARGMDASSAFEMLARAANGNVMAFSKMGIEFRKNATDAEKLNTVLGFINDKWSNAAQEKMAGYEGAVTRLSNTWGDLLENFGKTTTGSSMAVDFINGLSKSIQILQVALSWALAGFRDLFAVILGFGSMIGDVLSAIWNRSFGDLKQKLDASNMAMQDLIKENHAGIISMDSFAAKINNAVIPAIQKKNEVIEQSKAKNNSWSEGMIEGLTDIAGNMRSLGKTMSSTLVNGFTSAFAGIGKSLVSGKNAFNEFGKSMLSMLGTLCIQVGQFLILAGLGFSFLPLGFSGFGAIAAGVALTVLGGVLQALGGGGDTPASSGVGQTSSDGTMTGGSALSEQTKEEERAKAQTGIQVVVQGNIFDNRETGIQIAQIISDSFDINGTQIRGFA